MGKISGPNWADVKYRRAFSRAMDKVISPPLLVGLKHDTDKTRWSLLPYPALKEVADVLTFGSKKYADNNWKKVSQRRDRYFSAAMRHLTVWWDGEKKDPETGKSHLAHAICCLLFLLWEEKK